jgi:cytochrome oxidase complex assembly protein 1
MYCASCGQPLPSSSLLCPQCGRAQNPTGSSSTGCRTSWVKWLILGFAAFFLFIFMLAGGILGLVFYKMKDSEPARMAVQSLRQSPTAQEALGEIHKTGWPIGSLSTEGGGSGSASFSMSVEGSKAKGKYYASLTRVNGQWRFLSGRLQLADGRSVEIQGTLVPSLIPGAVSFGAAGSGGRQLRSDRSAVISWHAVEWPGLGITFTVPEEWKEMKLDKQEVEFRPEDRSAYFTANVAFFDQKIPFDSFLPSLVDKAAAQLKREEILGYARRDLGGTHGLLHIQRHGGGGTMAVWTVYFDTSEFGTASINFLLGAPSSEEFDRVEPVLGAILESIHFPEK